MIKLDKICVTYGSSNVVKNVSAETGQSEFIALVGPNGSGKSSLLKAIAGILPHGGFTNLSADRRRRAKQLSYLSQNASASENHVVRDIVALGRTPYARTFSKLTKGDLNAVNTAMEKCGIINFADRPFGELSGGEQTRVHLARALATEAPLLLADEPVTALDPYYQLSVMTVLKDTAKSGKTVIAALHDLSLAKRFCDRIWVMNNGCLISEGVPTEALSEQVLRDVFRLTKEGEIAT